MLVKNEAVTFHHSETLLRMQLSKDTRHTPVPPQETTYNTETVGTAEVGTAGWTHSSFLPHIPVPTSGPAPSLCISPLVGWTPLRALALQQALL